MKRSEITENKIRSRVGERSFARGKMALEKSDLIQLIRQMIARYSDLEELVHIAPVGNVSHTTSINPDLIRRQVEQAIKHGDYGHAYYGAAEGIANELETIMQQADAYRRRNDWVNTAVIYRTVLDELRAHHMEVYDHDGDLGAVFWDGSERLGLRLDFHDFPASIFGWRCQYPQ